MPSIKTYHVKPAMLKATDNYFSLTIPLIKTSHPKEKGIAILTSN
jgi:hypothetical protein